MLIPASRNKQPTPKALHQLTIPIRSQPPRSQPPEKPDVDPYFKESSGISSNPGPQVITRNILQDSKGGFGLATWNGIMRYDGTTFTNVTNKEGLRRYRAFSLLEDHQENIWLGTTGAGVYRYDGSTYKTKANAYGSKSKPKWVLKPLKVNSDCPSMICHRGDPEICLHLSGLKPV